MKRRYLSIPLLFLALAVLIVVQSASKRIISPSRAAIRDASHAIMAEPAAHGMRLSSHTGPDSTPYLLCQGLPLSGEKGRILRQQLRDRNLQPSSEPAVILLLHGHASRKENQLAIAERFCAAGFTCLIPDLPGHGQHPDKVGTFGQKETPLLLKLIEHTRKEHRLPEKVALFGLSQGGAVALQTAAAQPEKFTAVASLSTFANLSQTLAQTADNKSPLLATIFPIVSLNLDLNHDLDLKQISPAEAAKNLPLPVFIAHGQDDTFIPPSNAQTIYQNLTHPQKRLRIIPNAEHGNVLAKGHLIYADLCEFFLQAERERRF